MKVFWSKHKSTIALVVFAFLLGAAAGFLIQIEEESLEIVVPALTTLLAAFLGAWFAFRLQNNKEENKKHQENIEAANRALFMLSRVINELENIKKQVIDPVRDQPDRFLAMPPFLIRNYDAVRFDTKSLIFLLKSNSPNLLGELITEENRFHQAINSLSNRSELHRHEVQPLLEEAEVRIGCEYRIADIKKALGERIFTQITMATDDLIEHVDETLSTSEDLMKKFAVVMKEIYPKSKFITIEKRRQLNNAPEETD